MEKIDLMYSAKQADRLKSVLADRLHALMGHGQYIQGPEVREFEEAAKSFTGAKHAINCANGTDALTVALKAIDLKPGEVVFSPSFTYVATAEAICLLGGVPFFVDVEENYNISLSSLEQAIETTKHAGLKAKAVITVDLYGNPIEYEKFHELAKKHDIVMISDAAQSFGAEYKGEMIGSLADITTTSFFPTKPLGCYGDGGMVFTESDELANVMRSICFHGKGDDKYHHVRIGMNSRLDSMQAMVLSEKMKFFSEELEARRALAAKYNNALSRLIKTPHIDESVQSAWAVYTLRHKKREEILTALKEMDIPCNVYYRTPLHMQPAYVDGLKSNDLSNSETIVKEVFSLPMHAYIDEEQSDYIIDNMQKILKNLG